MAAALTRQLAEMPVYMGEGAQMLLLGLGSANGTGVSAVSVKCSFSVPIL
jgi:fibrillarin-like rRNA methylase